jgi:hypothetical protein
MCAIRYKNYSQKTRKQLKDSGSLCPGITLMVGSRKYSLECFYGLKRNEITTGTTKNGLDNRCRCCKSHYNTLNLRLRAGLEDRGRTMLRNKEWTSEVSDSKQSQSISFSARVLENTKDS